MVAMSYGRNIEVSHDKQTIGQSNLQSIRESREGNFSRRENLPLDNTAKPNALNPRGAIAFTRLSWQLQ